jgi:hypothetical protein
MVMGVIRVVSFKKGGRAMPDHQRLYRFVLSLRQLGQY